MSSGLVGALRSRITHSLRDRRIVPIKPRFHCRCGKTLNAELEFSLFASWFSVMVIKGPFLSSRSQS